MLTMISKVVVSAVTVQSITPFSPAPFQENLKPPLMTVIPVYVFPIPPPLTTILFLLNAPSWLCISPLSFLLLLLFMILYLQNTIMFPQKQSIKRPNTFLLLFFLCKILPPLPHSSTSITISLPYQAVASSVLCAYCTRHCLRTSWMPADSIWV